MGRPSQIHSHVLRKPDIGFRDKEHRTTVSLNLKEWSELWELMVRKIDNPLALESSSLLFKSDLYVAYRKYRKKETKNPNCPQRFLAVRDQEEYMK